MYQTYTSQIASICLANQLDLVADVIGLVKGFAIQQDVNNKTKQWLSAPCPIKPEYWDDVCAILEKGFRADINPTVILVKANSLLPPITSMNVYANAFVSLFNEFHTDDVYGTADYKINMLLSMIDALAALIKINGGFIMDYLIDDELISCITEYEVDSDGMRCYGESDMIRDEHRKCLLNKFCELCGDQVHLFLGQNYYNEYDEIVLFSQWAEKMN